MEQETDVIDAMVSIIRSTRMDLEAARLAAVVISVEANFNARAAVAKKDGPEPGRLADLLDFSEEILLESRTVAIAVDAPDGEGRVKKELRMLIDKITAFRV